MNVLIVLITLFPGSGAQTQPTPNDLLRAYLGLTEALATDNRTKTSVNAREFEALLNTMDIQKLSKEENQAFRKYGKKLVKAAGDLAGPASIKEQREALAPVSEYLWPFVKASGSVKGPVYYHYCPMKKAYWISREESIRNPYYGKQMLTCGKKMEERKK